MPSDQGRYRGAEGKNPSGLLIAVIRTLSSIDDWQVRETEKRRLEEAFEKCDRDLDEKIVQHYAELISAIKTFQSITERITSSHNKVKQVKEDLLSCKTLLRCKRDELKKLWIEDLEHKHVLQLLDEIESIRKVPQRIEAYMSGKHYLNATDLLVSAVESLEGPLLQVEGLGDLRLELNRKKLNLHMVLIDELHKHLYNIKSTCHLEHKNKDKNSACFPESIVKDTSPMPVLGINPMPTPHRLTDSTQLREIQQTETWDHNHTTLHEIYREGNSAEFMGILIKALAKLKKIPETVNAIMEQLEPELKQILKRSTAQVVESRSNQRGATVMQENPPNPLLELLELLFDKFKAVALAHSVVLAHLHQVMKPHENVKLYELSDVSAKIQIVLQVLLMDYLDVKNCRGDSEPLVRLSHTGIGNEFAAFFGKRKMQCAKFFKLESSSPRAISTRERKRELHSKSEELQGKADDNPIEEEITFVSKPEARNITVIFQPLLRFIQEIELMSCDLGPGQAKQYQLRTFLNDYMNIFLDQVRNEIDKEMAAGSLASFDTVTVLGVQRPLLRSTVVVENFVQDLVGLMQHLTTHSNQLLEIVCDKLRQYKDICNTVYTRVVQRGKQTISAFWSMDEDFKLLLQSLPSWVNMTQQNKGKEFTTASLAKEAEVLTCNLADKLIKQDEMLHDVSDLTALANLHESMEWISGRLKMFSTLIHTTSVSPDQADQPCTETECNREGFFQTLSDISTDFQDIADCCLLVLHLEVRIHCFHYLIPIAKQGSYDIVANGGQQSMDCDPLVLQLNKDISAAAEAMRTALQQHKFQYVFEGLGNLMSRILINEAQYFKRITESGINKMCRNIVVLQQNLANITLTGEADLGHAKQYYEMLYNTADEMLDLVVDQGVRYTELEYVNALSLLQRSRLGAGDPSTQNIIQLQRLKDIVRDKAASRQATKDEKDQCPLLSLRHLPTQKKSFSSKARAFLKMTPSTRNK